MRFTRYRQRPMSDDLDPLEQHLVEALRALEGPSPAGRGARGGRAGVARAGREPCDRPRRALAAGAEARLLHDRLRRARVATPSSRSRCARATLPSSTTARAASTSRGPARRDATAVGTSCSAWPPPPTSRSPAAGTRCSATATSRSSRRRRPSPRTCRAPSGVAFAIERARELGVAVRLADDAVVVCSFGDASLNHATAQSALNTAAHLAYRGQPLPLLFVCEDNGLGISVPTPEGWVEQSLHGRPELAVERVEGDDPAAVLATARELGDVGARAPVTRPSSICEPCATSATRAPTWRPPTGRARRSGPTSSATRCSRRAAGSSSAGGADGEELAEEYLEIRARDPRARAGGDGAAADRDSAQDVDAPARAARRRPPSPRSSASGGRRRRRAADARAGDRRRARRRARAASRDARLRRGRRRQGRRLRRHARAPGALRPGARVRHAARRDVDPRARARDGDLGLRPDPGDPVPRLPPQRGGPAARRGGDAPVLLAGRVSERDGRPDPGLRLPEGLRRSFPQRQRARGAAGHSRPRDRLPVAARRRRGDARDVRRRGEGGRQRLRRILEPIALYHTRDLHDGGRRALDRRARSRSRAGRCGVHAPRRTTTSRS